MSNQTTELVAIPVVVSFDELVPASQVERVWYDLVQFESSAGRNDKIQFVPYMFTFDQLMHISGELVRGGAQGAVTGQELLSMAQRYAMNSEYKRSTTFLRYMVCIVDMHVAAPVTLARIAVQTEMKVKFLVNGIFSQTWDVGVSAGVLRDFLYVGMWQYQMARLSKLSQLVIFEEATDLYARVSVHPDDRFRLRVGFFTEMGLIGGRDYLLLARPSENSLRCIERVRSRIENSGMRTVLADPRYVVESSFGMPI
jgi:hypothetical protein